MTLVDRVRSVQTSLRMAVDDDKLRLEIGRLGDRASALESAAEDLERAAIAAEELRSAGQNLAPEALHGLTTLAREIQVARDAIAQAPLVGAGDDFYKIVQKISEVGRRVTDGVAELWRRHRAGVRIPNVDEDFMDLLDQAGLEVAGLSSKVESALTRISILERLALPRRGDVASLSQAATDLQGAVESLGSLVPAAVREFIVQSSEAGGAPLDLLTNEVRDFLTTKSLASRYRIMQGR